MPVLVLVVVSLGSASACTLLTSLEGLSDGANATDGGAASADVGTDERLGSKDGGPETDADGAAVDAAKSPYLAAVLADNPLLYYRFGEAPGAPARDEVTGAAQAYPVQGVTLGAAGALAGDTNTAIALDGTGKIDLAQDADFEGKQPYSVEVWVSRATSGGNGIGFLVDHQAWSGGRRGWALRANRDDFAFERAITVDASTSYNTAGTNEPAVAGEWHHVVGTYDGTTLRLYVDSVRRDTFTGGGITLSKIGSTAVGKQNCSPCSGTGYYGTLDELAIYPQALNEARIVAHYKAGKGL